jgi:hypothetical protein
MRKGKETAMEHNSFSGIDVEGTGLAGRNLDSIFSAILLQQATA